MCWIAKDVVDRPRLDDAAAVHHGDRVDEVPDDTEIMADINDRDGALLAETDDHVNQAILRQDVEPGCRLVHDDHLWLADEGHRDRHPLLLAAAQLVRITPQHLGLEWELRSFPGRPQRRLPLGGRSVRIEHLLELITDRHPGRQRPRWVLWDVRDHSPAGPSQVGFAEGDEVTASDEHASRGDAGSRPGEAEERHRDGRLTATRLAYDSEGRACGNLERDVGDDLDSACRRPQRGAR